MVESTTLSFTSRFHLLPGLPRPASPAKLTLGSCSSLRGRSFHAFRCQATESGEGFCFGGDPYGPYPWESSSAPADGSAVQWVPENKITLFTAEGLIQIGGSLVPRQRGKVDQRHHKDPKDFKRLITWILTKAYVWVRSLILQLQMSVILRFDHLSFPRSNLCFAETWKYYFKGLNMGRRLCIFGFCRSIEMLSDVVEDIVLENGGEVVTAEKASKGGLQEKLSMTVAVPLLWGVPPASETLHFAVRSGGGIVDKVYWQWDFL
ncbi:hypothetical protein AXF42_Ash015801 [Apostasia shenzhenica]|uniref:DUF7811 domain-containing protein n=1 Tax=Apostasia shenzhenica TaxID=1088818 RepID=A0A2H9ZXK6_9ASPA|nr:hypothetical protein AXF42_Ash015801 [Apostasia shenzhenica]